jgi:hypothetical protein
MKTLPADALPYKSSLAAPAGQCAVRGGAHFEIGAAATGQEYR